MAQNEGGAPGGSPSSELDGVFIIERVIRHKTVKRRRRFYVSWAGYGPEANSWVYRDDILDKSVIRDYDAQRTVRRRGRIARMRQGKEERAAAALGGGSGGSASTDGSSVHVVSEGE